MLDIKIEVDRTHQRPLGVGHFFGIIFELLLGVERGWVGVERTVVDQRGVQRETVRVSSMIGRAKSTDAKFRVSFTSKRRLVLRTDRSVKHVFVVVGQVWRTANKLLPNSLTLDNIHTK